MSALKTNWTRRSKKGGKEKIINLGKIKKKTERKNDVCHHPRPELARVPAWQWVPQAVWAAVARDRAGGAVQYGSATALVLSASSGNGGSEVSLQSPGPHGPHQHHGDLLPSLHALLPTGTCPHPHADAW